MNDVDKSMNDMDKSMNDMGKSMNDMGKSMNDMGKSMNDMGKSMNDMGKSMNDMGKSMNDMGKSMNDMGKSMNDMGKSMNDMGKSMNDMGKSMNIWVIPSILKHNKTLPKHAYTVVGMYYAAKTGSFIRFLISTIMLLEHIETETEWPQFWRQHFQIHVLVWKLLHFDSNLIEIRFQWSNKQYASFGGSDDNSTPNRRQIDK